MFFVIFEKPLTLSLIEPIALLMFSLSSLSSSITPERLATSEWLTLLSFAMPSVAPLTLNETIGQITAELGEVVSMLTQNIGSVSGATEGIAKLNNVNHSEVSINFGFCYPALIKFLRLVASHKV